MSGKAFAIIGMRGMGKSTQVKALIKNVHPDALLIYDPNREYTEFYNRPFLPFPTFAEKANNVSNAVIVVEEATVFLGNRLFNQNFLEIIVRARHTNNTIILVYHSFKSINKAYMDLMNYIIVLKTADRLDYLQKTFDNPHIDKVFLEVKNAPLLVNKKDKRKYSPHKMVDLFLADAEETLNAPAHAKDKKEN